MVEKTLRVTSRTTVVYDEGLRTYFSNVFTTMAMGLAVTALVSHFVVASPELLGLLVSKTDGVRSIHLPWFALAIAELVLVWKIARRTDDRSVSMTRMLTMFLVYSAMNGATIAPVVSLYTGASVAKAFAIAAATFGTCALWGYTTKRDLRPFGAFLMVGLIGMIIALIANLFMQSTALDFALSVIGVFIFAGLTAWDMQMLRSMYIEQGKSSPGLVVSGALSLYLDFINLFQLFLRFFGVHTTEE